MLCCIRNRCNLSEHAPKKTPSSGFLCTGRSGVTTRKWIWISYFLFLSSLWCLWSSVSASSFGFCVVYHRLETVKGGWAQRERERGEGERRRLRLNAVSDLSLSASFELFNAWFWICSSKKSLIFWSFLVFQQHNRLWKPKILSVFGIKWSNLS